MRQLAVREVDGTPLVEQRQDLGLFPAQQAVDGVAAGLGVVEAAGELAVLPPPRPGPVDLEQPADPRQRPPGGDGVVDQGEQRCFDGRIDTSWDRAVQPQLAFPRSAANSMACSTIVAVSRSLSARRRASSDSSARSARGRPGRDAGNAAIAPSLATLRNVMIVVRSTPASAAAATVVSCPVSIRNHRSYFCSADKKRFARRAGPSV